jgi:hypothetical protein
MTQVVVCTGFDDVRVNSSTPSLPSVSVQDKLILAAGAVFGEGDTTGGAFVVDEGGSEDIPGSYAGEQIFEEMKAVNIAAEIQMSAKLANAIEAHG